MEIVSYEYKTLQAFGLPLPDSKLNELGEEGWELIHIFSLKNHYQYLFKRKYVLTLK